MKIKKNKKIAIIYDRINTNYGGAEHILQTLNEIYPDAPIYTSVYDQKKVLWTKNMIIKTSFLNQFAFLRNKHRLIPFLMPIAFETINLSQFDIIISITSESAKGIITLPHQLHICYLLTPTRYLYSHQQIYQQHSVWFNIPILNLIPKFIHKYLKWWDQAAMFRPDVIIPISYLIKQRIKKYYDIESQDPIYPPLIVHSHQTKNYLHIINQLKQNKTKFFLSVNRLVAYKQIQKTIKACITAKQNLIIVGDGPFKTKLEKMCLHHLSNEDNYDQKENFILFLGQLDSQSIYQLYKNAQALIMPQIEDFGLTALEANLFGLPVILNEKSGAAEILKNNVHAQHIPENIRVLQLKKILKNFNKNQFDQNQLIQNAQKYDKNRFVNKFTKLVNNKYNQLTKYTKRRINAN